MEKYQGFIRISRLYNVLVLAVGLLVATVLFLLVTIPFIETLRLQGVVHDNTLELKSPQAGVIDKLLKTEGSEVLAGSRILNLDLGRTVLYDTKSYSEKTVLLEKRIETVKKQISILKRKRQAENEMKALNLQKHASSVGVLKKNIAVQTEILKEQEALLRGVHNIDVQGALSRKDITEIKVTVANSRMKVLELRERMDSRTVDISLLKWRSNVALMEIDRQSEASENELAELKQKLLDLHSVNAMAVTAPESGRIPRLYVEPGEYVNLGDILATITPVQNGYELYLRSSSKKIGKIESGQKVKLWYEAFPKKDFGTYEGEVSYVGREPNYRESATQDSFLVKVKLDKPYVQRGNKKYDLVAGSTVDVSVQLGKKRILSWLLGSILERG